MSNPIAPNEVEPSPENGITTWDEVRRIADEIELKVHLAGMEARERWRSLEPRLATLEHQIKEAGQRASKAVAEELGAVWKALRGIQDDVANGN
jgi:hypothetical protein